MRAELRRARYGYLLALHVLLLCAAGRTPTEIATVLFCSRSSVYRIVSAYTAQPLDTLVAQPPPKAVWLSASLYRSLMALLKKAPSAYGWYRTRWSCAALAVQLKLPAGPCRVGLNHAALATPVGLGLEASPVGRARR